jgi:serine/threonine protein kinase/tetratricopeptide (TPR) repeat protein
VDSNRWEQINHIFHAALELEPDERASFLDRECAGDESLLTEVVSLIENDQQTDSFIERATCEAAMLASEDEQPDLAGRHIGPFKVIRRISQGGMGAVYLAARADGLYNRQVALKVIKPGMDTDFIIRRFRDERQILASLDHPNIAKLFNGGTTAYGLPYFVMEFIEGEPINEYCDNHKLNTKERLKLFCTVCSAVEHAHEKNVIHRDIKPANVLVTAEGAPKLVDFGIAKLLDPDWSGDRTATALRLMTPDYASPEQVRGDPVTPASDVYSLGVLLYEMLTGHRPYRLKKHAPHEIERIICEQEPDRPSTIINRIEVLPHTESATPITLTPESVSETREGTPEKLRRCLRGDLDSIVLKALRKEPEMRYSSVEEFSEDISRYLEGLPVNARKGTLSYRAGKFFRRHRAAMTSAALIGVSILMLAIAAALSYLWISDGSRQAEASPQIESIAVLPFKNLSPASEDEYLGLAMADALITRLSYTRELLVRPTSAIIKYTPAQKDAMAVGQELGVDSVLDGSIQRWGDQVRITVQVVNVRDGSLLWAGQFDENFSNIMALQDRISEDLTTALMLKLSGEEDRFLTKRYTENKAAYELYLKGRFFWNRRTAEDFRKAIEHFNQAIDMDPAFALAYAGLADCYAIQTLPDPPKELLPKAKAAALKALELDEMLAEAHASLAMAVWRYDFDWENAEREFKRAIELSPNYATAHQWYGLFLLAKGQFDEAIAETRRAIEIDPFSQSINSDLTYVFILSRRYDDAIEQALKAIELHPGFIQPYQFAYRAYREKGMMDEAIVILQKGLVIENDNKILLGALGAAYAEVGKRSEARKLIKKLERQPDALRTIAWVYSALGEKENALASLGGISEGELIAQPPLWIYKRLGERDKFYENVGRALEKRPSWLYYINVEPTWEPFRADPEFQDLIRRIGL